MAAQTIGVMADVHANLPALEAVLARFDREGCDEILCVGDFITIGPYPAECFDLLRDRGVRLLLGNHEQYIMNGLSSEVKEHMSLSEQAHHAWTAEQLGGERIAWMWGLPMRMTKEFDGVRALFTHYACEGGQFLDTVRGITAPVLDDFFEEEECDIVFYGHDHRQNDLMGKRRYLNPGALGCSRDGFAHGAVCRFSEGECEARFFAEAYDRQKVIDAFGERDVAGREEILAIFFS